MFNVMVQQIADRVIADCFDTATCSPVNRARILFHSWVTDWPEARGMSVSRRSVLIDLVSVEVGRRGCPQDEEEYMASKGDKVTFRSANDGKEHDGTVIEVADSPSVREQFGDAVLRVQASDTRRGWELVSGSDVRSR